MEKNIPLHLQEILFATSDLTESKQLSKLIRQGVVRKIATKIYTPNFVDTPEVERIVDYIGSQKAYASAYLLPEYVGEEGSNVKLDVDISERDSMFREAAEIIVTAQQGSASLLQRKLKLGYNRAGRLIDQLEAAGIVGPFEGSKARSVNILDLSSLDQFFSNEQNNN